MKYSKYFLFILLIIFLIENKQIYCFRIPKEVSNYVLRKEFSKTYRHYSFVAKEKNIKKNKIFQNEEIKSQQKRVKGIKIFSRDTRNPYLAYEYVNKMIENKKYEVQKLLEEHCDESSPLQIRLKYLQHTMNNKLSDSLKKRSADEKHRLSIIADLKRKMFCRKEETVEENENKKKQLNRYIPIRENNLLDLRNPGNAYMLLHHIGFDAVIVNTDYLSTGGNLQDFCDIVKSSRKINRINRPAIIMNDLFIHPLQIALAVENKADAVLLNFTFLEEALEKMLHCCVNLGIEAIVEVHHYNEIYYATKYGAYILMINEYDLLNNTYEYKHAIKAINYVVPEIITIAKIDIDQKNNINYVEQLGSLCYDSICLENKLKDDDLTQFISLCKNWNAPNKTILHMNRNNHLKQFLSYGNDTNSQKHKESIEILKNMYDTKNVRSDYSHQMLKKYEKDVLFGENEDEISSKDIKKQEIDKTKNEKLQENMLNNEENKIVNNFKNEKKKELLFLNQLKGIIKEVDDHCKQVQNETNGISEAENKKKEERLESLLENFTNMDKSYLREFFSDEEIANIENSIRQTIEQKKKMDTTNVNNEYSENDDEAYNQNIYNLSKDYFDYEKGDITDEDSTKETPYDISDDSFRGLSSQ